MADEPLYGRITRTALEHDASYLQRIVAYHALPKPYPTAKIRVIEVLACGHKGTIGGLFDVQARIQRGALRSCRTCYQRHCAQARRAVAAR